MKGILMARLQLFFRKPWGFLIMTVASIAFAFIIGSGDVGKLKVPVYASVEMNEGSFIRQTLKQSDAYSFEWMTEDEVKKRVQEGKAEAGIELKDASYEIIVGLDSENVQLIEQFLQSIYLEKKQLEKISEAFSGEDIKAISEQLKENQAFTIDEKNFLGKETSVTNQRAYHSLFGFTLFFVIYTIAYNVLHILVEKNDGLWDRIILSPVKKWEMYVANFMYSFLMGYAQVIVIFLVFHYLLDVDFNGNLATSLLLIVPYVFSIVALAIFITGVVKTIQQFNAVIPMVAVSMAMLGGAFWPLEIVENQVMLFLAKIIPITYGMELLKGTTIYNYSMEDLTYPVSVLLLIGVVLTGVGIHLMERRSV